MAAPCYIAFNGISGTTPFTDFPTAVTTGTSTSVAKTMLQVKPGTPKIRIIEWGYSFDATPAAPVKVGLVETGTVFATVTTMNAADIMKYNDATGPASQVVTGTSATGFTASAEGSIAAIRQLAGQHDAAQMFKQQFPLGREPEVNGGSSLRIRVTMGSAAALNMVCYVIWEE
jgi:hypothetical protein